MAENLVPNTDLAAILATLAGLQQPNTAPEQQQRYDTNQGYQSFEEGGQIQPPSNVLPYHQPADPRLVHRNTAQKLASTPRPQDRSSTPLIDPATIVEWKQGLRCVSKIAAHNLDFVGSVRKLMKDQEENVRQWDAGRTRLIEDHKLKRENEQTHRAALSLPGLLENSPLLRTPEREQEELQQYDAKVYRACKAMVESQTSSLKVLGVPFFGVRPHLILHESEETPSEDSPGIINKTQLLALQRKMLNHLMELYGD